MYTLFAQVARRLPVTAIRTHNTYVYVYYRLMMCIPDNVHYTRAHNAAAENMFISLANWSPRPSSLCTQMYVRVYRYVMCNRVVARIEQKMRREREREWERYMNILVADIIALPYVRRSLDSLFFFLIFENKKKSNTTGNGLSASVAVDNGISWPLW